MLTTRVVSDHEATDRLIAFCDRHDRHRAKHGETVSFWRKQNFFALDDPSLFPDVFESAAWPIANDLFLWAVRLGRTQVISALKLFASQTAVYAARYMTHTPVDQERLFKAIRGIPHVAQPVFLACLVFCPEYVTHVWTHHMPDYAWEAIRRNDACIVRGEGRPVSSLKVPVNPQVMRDGMIVSARHLYMPAHEYYHRHAAVNHRFDCVMDTLACKITKAIEPTCYGTVDATHSRRDAKGRGTVEVLDTNGRVMFSSTGPMSVRNMSDLVIKSGHRKIHVNEWRERGMYDVTVDHGKKMGRFPEVYVFLVVNGTMLYNRSDYDDIERGHAAMRAGVVAITQGIVSDTCPGAPCTTAHADTTGNTSVAVTAPNATLDESAHAVITAGGATGTM